MKNNSGDLYQEIADAVGITREQAKRAYMYRPYAATPKRGPSLGYFIGGNWKIGRMRDGTWQSGSTPDDDVHVYGGWHAGVEMHKEFIDSVKRLVFIWRMRRIYGNRFHYNVGRGWRP